MVTSSSACGVFGSMNTVKFSPMSVTLSFLIYPPQYTVEPKIASAKSTELKKFPTALFTTFVPIIAPPKLFVVL